MDSAVYLGPFTALPHQAEYVLEPSDTGKWQVWKMASGEYMVQPIDAQGAGDGPLDLITQDVFQALFAPDKNTENISEPAEPAVSPPEPAVSPPEPAVSPPEPAVSPPAALNTVHGTVPTSPALRETSAQLGSATNTELFDADSPSLLDYWYAVKNAPPQSHAPAATQQAQTEYSFTNGLPEANAQDPPSSEEDLRARQQFAATAARLNMPLSDSPSMSLPASDEALPPFEKPGAWSRKQVTDAEEQLRRDFLVLIDQLHSGATQLAQDGLRELINRQGSFAPREKFLFSEFGLALRREKQYELALLCHLRALAAAPNDEHVLFNLARTEYELGHLAAAKDYLSHSLAIDPDFSAAHNFMAFLNM